jgi:hypothetical protein
MTVGRVETGVVKAQPGEPEPALIGLVKSSKVHRRREMQQPHTETDVQHTDDQQDTGNRYKPGTPEKGGADRLGGTRAGAENVEPVKKDKA